MNKFDSFVLIERVKSKRNPSLRYEIKRSILTKPFSPKKKTCYVNDNKFIFVVTEVKVFKM